MTEMMAENKRYEIVNSKIIEDAFNIKDNKGKHSFPSVKDKSTLVMYEKTLNEQEELIKRLKTIREEQTETILKQKRKIRELEERNQRQYNLLKEITYLMTKKDWKTLENIVDEWEKQEELLQSEWGTYCGG